MIEYKKSHWGWNFINHALSPVGCRTLLIACLIFSISFLCTTSVLQVARAQQPSLTLSRPVIKVLLSDASKALDSGNTSKTLQNLNVVNQMISEVKENSSSIQATKLLIHDAIEAVQGGDPRQVRFNLLK